MSVLSDTEIIEALDEGMIKIAPFSRERLAPAGYDLASHSKVDLRPRNCELIATLESIELNPQIMGTIHLKSSFAREGVIGSFAIIDPGFRGQLTLSLLNSGTKSVRISEGEPIVQVVFHRTGRPAINPYNGKYQDSYKTIASRRRKYTK